MLRVVVELIPSSNPHLRRQVGLLSIANVDRPGATGPSSYEAYGSEAANAVAGTPAWTCVAEVAAHDRAQSVWVLVAQAAKAIADGDHVVW